MGRRITIAGLAIAIALGVLLVVILTRPPAPRSGDHDRAGATSFDDFTGEDRDRPESTPSGATVSGRVLLGSGPVAARVEILRLGDVPPPGAREARLRAEVRRAAGDPVAAVEAGADGRYEAAGLAVGAYRLRARASRVETASIVVAIRLEGEGVVADIRIPAGEHALRGIAVFGDGTPFRGRIALVGQGMRWTGTDADGRFRFEGLPAGRARLRAASTSLFVRGPEVVLPVVRPTPGEFRFVVDEGLQPLTVTVMAGADGPAVPAAAVRVSTGRDRVVALGTTGADGRVRLPAGVPAAIEVTAPGFAPARKALPLETTGTTVILSRAMRVTGRVVTSGDGAPVPGARVVARPDGRSRPDALARSDSDGRFELTGLHPGIVALFVLGGGHVSSGLADAAGVRGSGRLIDLARGDATDVVLVAERAAVVRGRVADETGAAVAGVPIRLVDLDDSGHPGWLPDLGAVATDADGAYRFEDVVPGVTYRVRAEPSGRAATDSSPRLVGAADEVTVDLVLSPERRIVVRVVAAGDGEPVVDARVDVQVVRDDTGERTRRIVSTDSDGLAVADGLPPGEATAVASHPEFLSSTIWQPVADTDGTAAITLELIAGLRVSGRVVDPDGAAAPGVLLQFRAIEPPPGLYGRSSVTTDERGTFRTRPLVPGRHRVEMGRFEFARFPATVAEVEAGSTDVVLRLDQPSEAPTGTVRFRILDAGGLPVPSGRVWISEGGGSSSRQETLEIADGRVEYGLRGGQQIWIEVEPAPGHGAGVRRGPFPAEPGEVEIRLEPGGEVAGVVARPDGAPVAGVRVEATPIPVRGEAPHGSRLVCAAATDARGAFRVPGIGAGRWRIEAKAAGARPESSRAVARAGDEDIRLVVAETLSVMIEVVDEDRRPVAGVHVSAHDADSRWRRLASAVTDGRGLARLTGLESGREHRLQAQPQEGLPYTIASLARWRPRDERLVLCLPREITGRVVDADGTPVGGARIEWDQPSTGGRSRAPSAEDGTFRIPGLPPGRVLLRVFPVGSRTADRDPVPVEVDAGAEGVVLVVESGASLTVRLEEPPAGDVRARLIGQPGQRGKNGRPPVWNLRTKAGAVTFRGLRPDGEYTVWLGPTEDGRILYREAVRPSAKEIVAPLTQGLVVRGRLTVPQGAGAPRVWAVHPRLGGGVEGEVRPDGRFEILGLPPGPLELHASAPKAGRYLQAKVAVRAGEERDLVITEK